MVPVNRCLCLSTTDAVHSARVLEMVVRVAVGVAKSPSAMLDYNYRSQRLVASE